MVFLGKPMGDGIWENHFQMFFFFGYDFLEMMNLVMF